MSSQVALRFSSCPESGSDMPFLRLRQPSLVVENWKRAWRSQFQAQIGTIIYGRSHGERVEAEPGPPAWCAAEAVSGGGVVPPLTTVRCVLASE